MCFPLKRVAEHIVCSSHVEQLLEKLEDRHHRQLLITFQRKTFWEHIVRGLQSLGVL